MKKFLPRPYEQGFSLIELVVVVAVLAILAAIGIPSFNAILKQALLAITKTSLIDNYKQCKMNSDGEINLSNIPGVVFQSNDCASDITATINSECTLKMNMSSGAKTGWADSYNQCVSGTNNSSGNGNGNGNGNGSNDNPIVDYCNRDPKPSACQNDTPGAYAVVDPSGDVVNVVVSQNRDPWETGTPGGMPDDAQFWYPTCNGECILVRQSSGGGHWGTYSHSDGIFTLEDGTKLKDGVGLRPNGELFNIDTNEILN